MSRKEMARCSGFWFFLVILRSRETVKPSRPFTSAESPAEPPGVSADASAAASARAQSILFICVSFRRNDGSLVGRRGGFPARKGARAARRSVKRVGPFAARATSVDEAAQADADGEADGDEG